jgi:choline dehydrogenase-like flavoprotein
MHSNKNGREHHTYDAIVVGSGISGGWAAKELCEKGLKVLLIERGKPVQHPTYPTALLNPWEIPHGGRITPEDRKKNHIQTRHYSYAADNKHFYINDLENPYTETKRYDWIRADVLGGRSLLWARHSYRFSPLDFEANTQDGHGVDWPIRYKDLEPWYAYVEKYIGISGQNEGLKHFPDQELQPPMEMNCVELDFRAKMNEKFPDRRVTIGRVANLTQELKGRGKCQSRNLCHRGCPFGAYFSSNSSTLPAAMETGNLTVLTNTLVNRVLYDEIKGMATGVETIDAETHEVREYFSRILFLNASTLGTTFLLLNSSSNRFPNGLGNDSDQVGRNLMDHHKQAGANADVEGFEDQYYTGRRPNSLYIPRFRNISEKRNDYVRGFGLMGGAGRQSWWKELNTNSIGATLKENVQTPGKWSIGLYGFGECLPYADNRVTLNRDTQDKWGRPTLTIDCEFKANEHAMQRDMASSAAEMLEAAGYKNVTSYVNTSFPGNANHEMGTARMGKDPKTSVLNAFNQMHAVKNVFITDGSCMTSNGCVNPSLTYMALSVRAVQYAVEEMRKQNI